MAELVIERLFDAPRDVVYQAFVDPDQVAQWFGPIGWSCPRDTISIDPVVGGRQTMTMVSDDDPAQSSPGNGTFVEVVENELLVSEERFDEQQAAIFGTDKMMVRLEFLDRGEQTLLRLTQGPYSDTFEKMAR